MAVTTFPCDSSVESVKLAVRSTLTCSNATVLSLQGLFRGPSKTAQEPEAGLTSRRTGRNTKESSTTSACRNNKTSSRGTKSKTSAKETTTAATALNALGEKDGARLSGHERLVLATEVFNTTLKTLSDAVKLSSSKRELSFTIGSTPLQPTSPNRAGKSPSKLKSSKSTQPDTAAGDQGLLSVAECARSALSCLRSLKSEQGDQCPNMQLEQGTCVLAGRFLSLGLNDLTYKELRALKRRIQNYLDSVGTDSKKGKKDPQEEEAKERMSDLLIFTNIAHARPLLGLLVTYQSNALRLISAEKRPATTQKVCPSLQLSDSSSPAAVIMAAVESGALPKDKGALQLQLLSNTVLSLASASQQQNDDATTTAKYHLRPITSLTFQLLSLEIRSMGWKLSGHACDEGKEVWDPLSRYLSSFAHHGKGIEKSEFALLYKTIVRLQATIMTMERKSGTLRDTNSVAKIATILGQLAQDADCLEEALKLFTEALTPLSDGQCLSLASVRCKIASLHFQRLRSSGKSSQADISGAVSKGSEALGLQLKGSAHDLDELLVESSKLKKVAMAWLGDTVTKEKDKDAKEGVIDQIREYLQGYLRFLRRYIGRQPSEESDAKEHELFQRRINASKSIVLAGVDSAVAMGKLSVMSQSPPWDNMMAILVDCQRLLTTIDSASRKDSSAMGNCGMGLVKLSNLFWSRYLKEKEVGRDFRVLVPLLKQSTTFLSSCSLSHRNTAFAALKYERLAHLYLDGNMGSESDKAFCQSIKEHIDAGALDQVVADSAGNYLHRTCQDPKSNGFMLGRAISGLLRMKLRSRPSEPQDVFDDEELTVEQRGHILELQMGILTELHAHAYSDEVFRSTFTSVVSKLLDLYSVNSFPIRRMRTMLYGVRFSLECPSSLESSLVEEIVDEGADVVDRRHGPGNDYLLAPYTTHVRNTLRLTIGFHQGTLQPDELNQVISSWTCMLQQCDDWKSLGSCVLDVDYWLIQLKAVVDYTEIHGLWKVQLSALELVLRITELQDSGDFSEAIVVLSRLVLQYCRLGHCKKAGGLLVRAEQCLRDNEVSCLANLSYKLARVEYLLETGDVDKAATILSAARVLYERNQKQHDLNNCSVLSKISWERLVADAAFINSRLSFAQGSITHALFFAKLSVRLNCRIWAKVERLAQRKQCKGLQPNGSEMDSVVDGLAKLDVSQTSAPESSVSYFQGAPFWPHIGSHHTSLLNLASLSAHHGLFQDAVYYGEQALKVNRILNANVRLVASQAQLGSHWVFGGRLWEGQGLLESAATISKQIESSIELVSLQMGLASLHRAQGHYREEHRALLEADKIVSDVIHSETSDTLSVPDLEEKMDKLQIRGGGRRAQPAPTANRRTRTTSASARTVSRKPSNQSVDPSAVESKSLLQLRTDLLRHQADCSRALRDFDTATSLLTDARQYALSRDSQISLHIGEGEHLLADAIRHFATHAVYCVLPESTISLPSLESPKKVSNEESPASMKTPTVRRTRAPTRGGRSKTAKTNEDFAVMLSKAGDCLNTIFPTATSLGSTLDSHAVSRLMSRISMLSQTTAPGSASWSHAPVNVNEIGRIGAFNRERVAIELDKQLTDFNDPLLWPTSSMSTVELEDDLCANFTQDYVDILPDNWNVLSLSLSADCTEFVVSRLHKGQTPFLLRLPLKRGSSDEDEEQFTFEDGHEEMQELIKLANESAHAAKAQVDKHMKKQWWKNREALDCRMENLLQNIENVWFGGFRGIFSPVSKEKAALGHFASSFHSILDKHLPSRQKGGRSTTGPKLTLHRNVLELFIGIKDLEEQEDPEETLMDLLYFVVDILQFQGERNAYDEIDFDMMVVETFDALRGYHEAVRRDSTNQQTNHTVLILDKALHLFPWESLPCLQGSPVCRVPSLECVRDRVLRFRGAQGTNSRLNIDRTNGTYILNPTGDLQTTQKTFEQGLARLNGWNGIVNRQLTEDEFRESLENHSLFLYFGHGSGAQYIRGRTIKRLDQCAVAFLMGCSSGTLTEAGDYEPYGTPMNYLHAGSPALVATLWDVTDKDIDRFAQSTFERWGLISGDGEGSSSKKGKSRASPQSPSGHSGSSSVALDEAVCESRGACVLKYLNGAAPVIYGVPSVYLE